MFMLLRWPALPHSRKAKGLIGLSQSVWSKQDDLWKHLMMPTHELPGQLEDEAYCHRRLYSARATSWGICQMRLMQRQICAQSQKLIDL
jgi:hypothetical protein